MLGYSPRDSVSRAWAPSLFAMCLPLHSKLLFSIWCYSLYLNDLSISGRQILFCIVAHNLTWSSPYVTHWPSSLDSSHTNLLLVPKHAKLVPAFKPLHSLFFLPGIPPPDLCLDAPLYYLNLSLDVTFPREVSPCGPTRAVLCHLSPSSSHHILSFVFTALINSWNSL